MKKDSGFCWIVLLSSFLCQSICLGIPLSFGIYFAILSDHFKNYGKGEIAAIGSIAYGVSHMTSPMASFLYRKQGCRFVIVLGAAIGTMGLFLSYFTEKLWNLYITYGVMLGTGSGLIYAPSLAILPMYFDKYRYFATSFATVGGALGTFILPMFFLKTIELYTWRGSLMLAGGLMFHVIVFGMFMKTKPMSSNATSKLFEIEKYLFFNWKFYLLCFESFCFGACSITTFSLINVIIMRNGLSLKTSTLLVSVIGVSNIVGRISAAVISHNHRTNRRALFTCMSLFVAMSTFFIPSCYNFASFAVTLTIFGISYGARISQVSGVLIDTFGMDKLSGMIGYYLCAGGAGALSGPPVAGMLADYTSLDNALYFAAGFNVIDFILCAILLFVSHYRPPNNFQKITYDDIVSVEI